MVKGVLFLEERRFESCKQIVFMNDSCHSGAGTVVYFLIFFTRLTSQLGDVTLASYVSSVAKERRRRPQCCSHSLLPGV